MSTNEAMRGELKKDNIKKNAINFFMFLLDLFELNHEITTTSNKLGSKYGKSERSIQRYVKELNDNNLLYVRHVWAGEEPNRYIKNNVYSLTTKALNLLSNNYTQNLHLTENEA